MNIICDAYHVTRILKNDKNDLLHILNYIMVIIQMPWLIDNFNNIQNKRFEITTFFVSVLQIISFLISWIHCTENKTISENQTILVCEIYCLVQIMCTVFWCACFCHLCRPNYLQSNSRVIKNGRILFHSQAAAYIIFIAWYA